MAEREQIRKPAPNERENETADNPSASERGEELKAELDDRGIQTKERDAVQTTCKRIFTQEDQAHLTTDGMKIANGIAHGGFKTLEESFPGNTSPRSQFELLTHVATLLAES